MRFVLALVACLCIPSANAHEVSAAPSAVAARMRASAERVLAAEDDEARALLESLAAEQRRDAVFDTRTFGDIVTSNAAKVEQDGGNHVHTVWRSFNGDFGRDLLREHYEAAKGTPHRH